MSHLARAGTVEMDVGPYAAKLDGLALLIMIGAVHCTCLSGALFSREPQVRRYVTAPSRLPSHARSFKCLGQSKL